MTAATVVEEEEEADTAPQSKEEGKEKEFQHAMQKQDRPPARLPVCLPACPRTVLAKYFRLNALSISERWCYTIRASYRITTSIGIYFSWPRALLKIPTAIGSRSGVFPVL